jgi:hypothetical protein
VDSIGSPRRGLTQHVFIFVQIFFDYPTSVYNPNTLSTIIEDTVLVSLTKFA